MSSVNLSNLVLQTCAVGLVSVGIVHVLLLGEIDLSVGAVSGLCASIMAVLNVKHGWSPYLAIAAAVAAGAAIGLFQGSTFTRFVVPSFVVTLAGLLAWPGFQLKVLGETGTVNLNDPKITGLTSTFYSDTVGWIMAFVAIAVYAALALRAPAEPGVRQGLSAPPLGLVVLRIALIAVAILVGGLGAERRPRRAAGGADPGRVLPVLLLRDHADHVRAPHLRGRRQRGGGAPGRHPRDARARDRVRHLLDDGGGRRRSWPRRGSWR